MELIEQFKIGLTYCNMSKIEEFEEMWNACSVSIYKEQAMSAIINEKLGRYEQEY